MPDPLEPVDQPRHRPGGDSETTCEVAGGQRGASGLGVEHRDQRSQVRSAQPVVRGEGVPEPVVEAGESSHELLDLFLHPVARGVTRAEEPVEVHSSTVWLVLVTGLTQPAGPAFLFVGNSSLQSGASGDPAVVPAGYTFAVWAVICLLGAAWAVWQMRGSWADDVLDRLALPLAGVFAGFTVWLVFSETGPKWATVVVFTAMLIGLLSALRTVHTYADDVSRWSRAGAILLHLTVGTYAGWTSVAVWVNLATVLADGGAPIAGVAGVAGQLAVLAGATATCCAVIVALHPTPACTLTAAWALVGAVAGAITVSAPLLAAAAGAGLAVVVAVAVTTRWHVSGRPHSRTVAPGASVADGHAR